MSTRNLAMVEMLLARKRYAEAEEMLRQALAEDPQDAYALSLLAITLSEQRRFGDAVQSAQRAIGLAPDDPFCHYAMASVLEDLEKYDDALKAIETAIRLEPNRPSYYARLSSIYLSKRDWKKALQAAEAGRALEPENIACANLQAIALTKLGRKDEAARAIGDALSEDPENAVTHANQGWAMLYANNHEVALLHFQEALRINPALEWARQGIVEALKARNLLYRLLLRYFLWMSRLGRQAQWLVIIGFLFLPRILRSSAASLPALQPLVTPIMLLYLFFALLSWIAQPLFNLLLRLDKAGRMALSEEQVIASNWIGLCVAGSGLSALAALVTGNGIFWSGAIGALAMSLPVAGVFNAKPGNKRNILILYTLLLALVGGASLVSGFSSPEAGSALSTFFMLGWVGYTWLANILFSVK